MARPWTVIAVIAVALVASGLAWPRFAFDASSDTLIVADDPAYIYYLGVAERFPTEEFLIITYAPREQALFSTGALDALRRLQNEVSELPEVKSTYSILDAPLLEQSTRLTAAQPTLRDLLHEFGTGTNGAPTRIDGTRIDGTGGDQNTDRLVAAANPNLQRRMAAAKQELTHSPVFGQQLVSTDGESAAIRVVLGDAARIDALKRQRARLGTDPKNATSAEELDTAYRIERERFREGRAELIERIRHIRDQYDEVAEIFIGGVPMIAADMIRYVRNDVVVFTSAVTLIVSAMLFVFFRRVRWVMLSVLNCGVTIGLMVGLLAALGTPVTVVSANFVSLLAIITISFTIHLVVRYRELLRLDPTMPTRSLVLETMHSKFAPCLYTALTTIVAFSSLTTSRIVPVIDFGWMMATGVGIAFVTTYTLFPAALLVIPPGHPSPTLGRPLALAEISGRAATRAPRWTLVTSLAVAVLAAAGLAKLSLESKFSDYFRADSEIRQGLKFIDENFGGTLPLDIILQLEAHQATAIDAEDDFFHEDDVATHEELTWITADKIRLLNQLSTYLEQQPQIGSHTSLAQVEEIARRFNGGQPLDDVELALAFSALTESQNAALVEPFANPRSGELRVSTRVLEGSDTGGIDSRIAQHARDELGVAIDVTGMFVLLERSLNQLYDSQRSTLIYVLLITFLMFLVLLRSPKFALFGLAANSIAAASVLAYMGYAGVPLDMMTITIAAICIGISVDDAIHYLHRYRSERRGGASAVEAVLASHRSIGRAIYFTSATVVIGFSVLALSNFVPTIYFGLLTALAMVLAMIANLLLLPSLLVVFDRRPAAIGESNCETTEVIQP